MEVEEVEDMEEEMEEDKGVEGKEMEEEVGRRKRMLWRRKRKEGVRSMLLWYLCLDNTFSLANLETRLRCV